jgi:spermidine synthase
MDVYSEEKMPAHLNTKQFFASIHHILSEHGCLSTNANLPTTESFHRLTKALSATFEMNILLAHKNINEDARIIISGSQQNLLSIASREQAIQKAQRFESNVHLEFSMTRLLSLAYRGPLTENTVFN